MPPSTSIARLVENMEDVHRLLGIHTELTGEDRGRRRGVEVLNKSGVILVTAAWEAFVEDLATEAFVALLGAANDASVIPAKVKSLAAQRLRDEKNPTKLWDLADAGWRVVLEEHKATTLKKHVGPLNTPNAKNTDDLFEALVGLRGVSGSWNWRRQRAERSRQKLTDYIKVRGQIAHRLETEQGITKAYARAYANFVYRLAVKSANRVRTHVESRVGAPPWDSTTYREIVGDA